MIGASPRRFRGVGADFDLHGLCGVPATDLPAEPEAAALFRASEPEHAAFRGEFGFLKPSLPVYNAEVIEGREKKAHR